MHMNTKSLDAEHITITYNDHSYINIHSFTEFDD